MALNARDYQGFVLQMSDVVEVWRKAKEAKRVQGDLVEEQPSADFEMPQSHHDQLPEDKTQILRLFFSTKDTHK